MWYDGVELMLENQWTDAIDVFRLAYDKKEGWGWAVNYGDIWLSEAVALMIRGAKRNSSSSEESEWVQNATELIQQAINRANDSGAFGTEGHIWIQEVFSALESYNELSSNGKDTSTWLEEFESRTIYWCSQILAGMFPFPPKLRNRLALESVLIENLPGHNE